MRTHAFAVVTLVSLGGLALIARSDPSGTDWPMWGGTPDRNMVSSMKGLPVSWDVKTKKNVRWVAELGSQAYGNPVVSGGVVLVGTKRAVQLAVRNADAKKRYTWLAERVRAALAHS